MTTYGNIHSIETCGTVDGPGIRFVVFLQGCPLRCQYCHNPDTWSTTDGSQYAVDTLITEALKYKSYMQFSKGGVTVTGGEPLLQSEFVLEMFKALKAKGIHTALDTSGFIFNDTVKQILEYTDLVLLDVKHFDPKQFKVITGVELDNTLKFLDYLGAINKDTWVRYVLVPELSDQLDSIEQLSAHLGHFNNIKKIELLPFHKMGEYKWEELNQEYKLKDTPEPTQDIMEKARDLFKKYNENVN